MRSVLFSDGTVIKENRTKPPWPFVGRDGGWGGCPPIIQRHLSPLLLLPTGARPSSFRSRCNGRHTPPPPRRCLPPLVPPQAPCDCESDRCGTRIPVHHPSTRGTASLAFEGVPSCSRDHNPLLSRPHATRIQQCSVPPRTGLPWPCCAFGQAGSCPALNA